MFHLVYASAAVGPPSSRELLDRLSFYREKNLRLGITGLLLYKQGEFMQALEGDEATVRLLFDTIKADRRHEHVHVLVTVTVPRRQFPRWSMGFKNLDEIDVGAVPDYTPYVDVPAPQARACWKSSIAISMLTSFMHEY